MFLECCNKLRLTKAYELEVEPGYIFKVAFYLESCATCGATSIIIKKYDPDYNPTIVRKKNDKARELYEKIKPYITRKFKPNQFTPSSNFWLYYNEFGSIKKSYANLSSLQMGLFDTPGLDLPEMPQKLNI